MGDFEGANIYLFLLFLVSITIPWRVWEVAIIWFMHLSAFSILFLYFQTYFPQHVGHWYADGVLFLFTGFILCAVVRKKESSRDIENFILLKESEKINEQMHRELELATRIHKTLIPRSISTDAVDINVTYLPVSYMGGDYAKYHFTDDGRLLFIICDVTGHGVSAALTVNRLHTELERLVREEDRPGALLEELNKFLMGDFEGANIYLSAFCGLIDIKGKKLAFSNHGHPAQYLYKSKEGEVIPMPSQASLLGISRDSEGADQSELSLDKGDRLLLFTDGIIECKGVYGSEYGSEALEGFIRSDMESSGPDFSKRLIERLRSFNGGGFDDDIFLLDINIKN
jgi:serine phosphatase RsbU (regulator of sigma subunit)